MFEVIAALHNEELFFEVILPRGVLNDSGALAIDTGPNVGRPLLFQNVESARIVCTALNAELSFITLE